MKNNRKTSNRFITYLFSILLVGLIAVGCSDDDDPVAVQQDLVELAVASGYNTLAAALTEAELVTALKATGPFTVFAPTDAAFAAAGITADNVGDVENLESILLYHVVSGAVRSSDLTTGSVATLNAETIAIDADNLTVNGISIAEPFDVEASNGIIHTIDGVLIPESAQPEPNPTIVEAATAAGLTTLLDAVTAADLGATLLEAEAITVFAPTNDAFGAALEAYGVSNLDELVAELGGLDNLGTVLGFHVVPAVAFAEDLADGEQMFETLAGQMLTVTKTSAGVTVTDANGTSYSVVTADVAIENGVVHVIDGVLLPELALPTIVEAATAAELTTLLDAVTAADLGSTLLDAEAITVFAPTNDAFGNALEAYGVSNLNQLVAELGGLENLVSVLGFHVVPAIAFSHDLADGDQMFETLAGQMLTVNKSADGVTVTDANGTSYNVAVADVAIANGVVHVIDGVLLPEITLPNIVDAATDAGLTTLLDAVTALNLGGTLTGAEAITVFAPTNQAFADLLEAQDVADLDGLVDKLGAEAVTDVLTYHVVPAVAFSHDLSDGDMFETLDGEMLTVNVTENGVTVTDVNGNVFTVTAADVAIENGVVHVIDGVLLPTL
ncbi:fasciclin domain-containing protein [Fulvivirga lutimaris]|uniref:fasciclin domain-containing protein n=1 Tax=Fulvivirga lutimaris TaxID=1819566 RepID=UPI0012BD49BB|nr:fasciclin domain-containing protein [Fulvivirga lutimaris]MTI41113.1 fasciclin domain-containing protein [Fulvivirga lutimaris]